MSEAADEPDAALTPLAFHAVPPSGEWLNDPNMLAATPGGYRLYAQHRADAPDYRATAWGSFHSDDLLGWRWTGVALPAGAERWTYSGSGVRTPDGLELFHTVHDAATGLEHQRRLLPDGDGWAPAAADAELSRPRKNRRDPFVFAWRGEWRMLLTQSCDWHRWPDDAPSYIVVLASPDRQEWREVGRIGPWHPQGVLWEVPVLARLGGHDVLFVSLVDRRDDRATCSVRGWVGRFDGVGFAVDRDFAAAGQLVDLGPDYYAQVQGATGDWPEEAPFVAWAASWNTARARIWPGFAGGPISLPRRIELRDHAGVPRLWSTPWPALDARFRPATDRPGSGRGTIAFEGSARFVLTLAGPDASLRIEGDPATGRLFTRREGPHGFSWSADRADAVLGVDRRRLSLFIDGPLIELFDQGSGVSVTAALPGGASSVSLAVADNATAFAWSVYTP